jgi:hypothetical protein
MFFTYLKKGKSQQQLNFFLKKDIHNFVLTEIKKLFFFEQA